jgi:uncharacterized protein (TIGR02001 family)
MSVRFAIALSALAILPATAFAENNASPPYTITGSATLASDYVFRGFSQTDEEPAIQGSVGLTHQNGLALSLWGSNVDFNDGDEAASEFDATVSYTASVGPVNFTLDGIYYAYPGADDDLDYDYVEGFAGVSRSFENYGDYSLQAFYSPDFFAGSGDAVYTTVSATIPTPVENLKAVGSIGHQWIEDNDQFGAEDYADWSLGATYGWDKVTFGVRYFDTDIADNDCSSLCDSRVVGSIGVNF